MILMDDWQLEVPGESPYAFGRWDSPVALEEAPSIGTPDERTDDSSAWRSDGDLFGEDFLGGRVITFGLTIVADSQAEAAARHLAFERAWRADAIRRKPGAVAELRSHSGRSVYGRPRQVAPNDAFRLQGAIGLTAAFKTADALWYGDWDEVTVPFAPLPSGGFRMPFSFPLSTSRTSDRSVVVEVGGTEPTPLLFEVRGPITNPAVFIGEELVFDFRGLTLAYDDVLRFDARPWERTIRVNGGSAAGKISASSTRIAQAIIRPGIHDVALRGLSSTANASLKVRHRPAFLTQ